MALKSKPVSAVRQVPVDVVSKEDIVRINLNVPESLRQQWKRMAVDKNKTMTELIIEAMMMYSDK